MDNFTIKNAREYGRKKLSEAGITEADIDTDYFLMEIFGLSKSDLVLKSNDCLEPEKQKPFMEALNRRCDRIPLAYILGHREFMGLDFLVNENVLIPRQDTEILVEEVSKYMKNATSVLDVCTGSGCIIISLAKLYNNGDLEKLVAVDISSEALKVAGENAKKHEISVDFRKGDLFYPLSNNEKFDIITINPPYIESRVIETLLPEVSKYEPRLALDGGDDGLNLYKRIAESFSGFLKEEGHLFLEIGFDQAMAVSRLFNDKGYNTRTIQDYNHLDRVVCVGKDF